MTTNGWLLEEYASILKRVGVCRINVSLDTLKNERYRYITGVSGVEHVLRGIDRAHDVGFDPVRINMVPLLGINEDEIIDFVELTRAGRVTVRFIERMPFHDSKDEGYIPSNYLKELIESHYDVLVPRKDMTGFGPARYYYIPSIDGTIGLIASVSQPMCGSCRRLRLTSDGRLFGCLADACGTDLRKILRVEGDLEGAIKKVMNHKLNKRAYDFRMTLGQPMSRVGG